MKYSHTVLLLLRVGLAFVYFYAATASIVNPSGWVGYFPVFLRQIVPEQLLLTGFSLFEIVLGSWLLFGKKVYIPALLSIASQAGIILFNFGAMDIVFRDVGLLFASLALFAGTFR